MNKKKTSITLTEKAKELLAKIAEAQGISQTAVIELLIREKAKQENIK
jgi:hypothetical protein